MRQSKKQTGGSSAAAGSKKLIRWSAQSMRCRWRQGRTGGHWAQAAAAVWGGQGVRYCCCRLWLQLRAVAGDDC